MEHDSKSSTKREKAKYFLLIILMANFFRNLGTSIIDIGLPNFIISLSGTLTAYGLVVGIFSITQSISQFPIASASDKYGRKKMIAFGMIIYISGTFLCYTAQDIIQLIIFRAIQGAGAYSSILQTLTCEHFDKDEQGKAMAFYSSALSIGYFGGIILGGYIAYYFSFRIIFLLSGTLALSSLILLLLFLKTPRKSDSDPLNTEPKEKILPRIKTLIKERQYSLTVFLNSSRWLLLNGSMVYIIWLLQIHWGLNEIDTSFLLIFVIIVYISFVMMGGPLVDRYGSRKMLLLGQSLVIIAGLIFIIVSLTENVVIFLISSFISGIGFAFFQTAGNSHISNVIGEKHPNLKGSGFGFNNAIGFLLGGMGPIILSLLGEMAIYLPYYFMTFLVSINLIVTLKYIENIKIDKNVLHA